MPGKGRTKQVSVSKKGSSQKQSKSSQERPQENTDTDPEQKPDDVMNKFEDELCWCIEKLQSTLSSKKLNPKEVENSLKTLKLLQNPKVLVGKKRQLMRLTFGDYRKIMEDESKKYDTDARNLRIHNLKPQMACGQFVRSTSHHLTSGNDNITERFQQLGASENIQDTKSEKKPTEHFKFTPSGNEFRFQFVEQNNYELT